MLANDADRLKLAEFQQKEANGTLTLEEMREVVKLMRNGRMSSAESYVKAKKAASAKVTVDADALLSQLEGL